MDKYDIIIQAGQSNAIGCGRGEVTEEYAPKENILYLVTDPEEYTDENGKWGIRYKTGEMNIVIADDHTRDLGTHGDFGLSFAQEYLKAGLLAPDRKLLIVRAGVGGTGFVTHFWDETGICYRQMLRMTDHAVALNPENRIVGLLWHQGENEAFEGNKPETYYQQLKFLIDSVKERYCLKDIPFVCGGFCKEWADKYRENCDAILAVIRQIGAEYGAYVETEDLKSNNQDHGDGDDIHFCRESLHILGKRYFEAYRKQI